MYPPHGKAPTVLNYAARTCLGTYARAPTSRILELLGWRTLEEAVGRRMERFLKRLGRSPSAVLRQSARVVLRDALDGGKWARSRWMKRVFKTLGEETVRRSVAPWDVSTATSSAEVVVDVYKRKRRKIAKEDGSAGCGVEPAARILFRTEQSRHGFFRLGRGAIDHDEGRLPSRPAIVNEPCDLEEGRARGARQQHRLSAGGKLDPPCLHTTHRGAVRDVKRLILEKAAPEHVALPAELLHLAFELGDSCLCTAVELRDLVDVTLRAALH